MNNKIIESIFKSEFPNINVTINKFKHKKTKEIRFCIMQVSTSLTNITHNFIYDASEWEKIDDFKLDGTERILECFYDDLIKIINKED